MYVYIYICIFENIHAYLHHIAGPKGHLNRSILYSGAKAQDKGIPETMVVKILLFT